MLAVESIQRYVWSICGEDKGLPVLDVCRSKTLYCRGMWRWAGQEEANVILKGSFALSSGCRPLECMIKLIRSLLFIGEKSCPSFWAEQLSLTERVQAHRLRTLRFHGKAGVAHATDRACICVNSKGSWPGSRHSSSGLLTKETLASVDNSQRN